MENPLNGSMVRDGDIEQEHHRPQVTPCSSSRSAHEIEQAKTMTASLNNLANVAMQKNTAMDELVHRTLH